MSVIGDKLRHAAKLADAAEEEGREIGQADVRVSVYCRVPDRVDFLYASEVE